jgi:hypothetical protein
MGSSSSKSSQKYETNIVNETDINMLDKTINDFTVNSAVEQAKGCSAGMANVQEVTFKNVNTKGDAIFDINQNMTANVTFDCVQVTDVKNDVANDMVTSYLKTIEDSFDANTLEDLEASAGSAASSSFMATGAPKSSSDSSLESTTNITNTTNVNLETVVQNAVTNNFDLKSFTDCVTELNNTQSVDIQNVYAEGNVIGVIKQDMAADLMGKCIQKSNNANSITQAIANDIGVTFDKTNTTTKTTEGTTTATSETDNKGVGEAANEFMTGIGNMFGGIFGSILKPEMISGCSCVSSIAMVMLTGVVAMMGMGTDENGKMTFDLAGNVGKLGEQGAAAYKGMGGSRMRSGMRGGNKTTKLFGKEMNNKQIKIAILFVLVMYILLKMHERKCKSRKLEKEQKKQKLKLKN